jgi:hypothetical protein
VLGAKQIMLTHMNPSVLTRLNELRGEGALLAEDGLVMEV